MSRTRSPERTSCVYVVVALAAAGVATYAGAQDSAQDSAQDNPSIAQSCVHTDDIHHTKVVDNRSILFYLRNDTVWENVLPRQCFSLGLEKRFGYEVRNHQLCAGSFISVIGQRSPYVPAAGFGMQGPDMGAAPGTMISPSGSGGGSKGVNTVTTQNGALTPTYNCKIGMFLPISDDEVDKLLAAAADPKANKSKRKGGGPIKTEPAVAPPAAAAAPAVEAPAAANASTVDASTEIDARAVEPPHTDNLPKNP